MGTTISGPSPEPWKVPENQFGFWTVSILGHSLWASWLITSVGWLSPELYLRRPPAQNEQYRLDRMLQAAAQRGVKVNIIVYKEVERALTCEWAPGRRVIMY
jgi:hypothetical protein